MGVVKHDNRGDGGRDDRTFGQWLKDRLAELDMRQGELAHAVGVSSSTASRWVGDQDLPEPIHCERIAVAVGVSRDEALRRAGHTEQTLGRPTGRLSERLRAAAAEARAMESQIERLRTTQPIVPWLTEVETLQPHVAPDDSLVPLIWQGDVALIDPTAVAEAGLIALVKIGQQRPKLRLMGPDDQGIALISAAESQQVALDDVTLLGVVVATIHHPDPTRLDPEPASPWWLMPAMSKSSAKAAAGSPRGSPRRPAARPHTEV